jgi:hypothetical protein
LDEKGLSRQCLNCAGNIVSWYAICLDCIHIREDATPQEDLGLLRAVLVLADWLHEGICEVVEAHLPGVTYQSTDMYLSSVALFVHVAGEYAHSQAGHIAQSWLLDRISQSLVRDTVIDLQLTFT